MDKPNDWFKCGNDVHAAIRKAERERVLVEVERLRTVLDSEDSLLRQLSEWLRK